MKYVKCFSHTCSCGAELRHSVLLQVSRLHLRRCPRRDQQIHRPAAGPQELPHQSTTGGLRGMGTDQRRDWPTQEEPKEKESGARINHRWVTAWVCSVAGADPRGGVGGWGWGGEWNGWLATLFCMQYYRTWCAVASQPPIMPQYTL